MLKMDIREEVIIKIIGQCTNQEVINISQQIKLKSVLESVMADYDVATQERSLVVSDVLEKMEMYLMIRLMDGLSPLTIENYRGDIVRFSKVVIKPINMITQMDVRRYFATFIGKVGKGTYSTKVSYIKSFFSWLASQDIIEKDPCKAIETPKIPVRISEYLTQEEMEIMYCSCKTKRDKSLIWLFYTSGVRLSELVSLDIASVDFINKSFSVIGKENKERQCHFSDRAKVLLKDYLNSRTDSDKALFVTYKFPFCRLKQRGVERDIKIIGLRSGINKNIHTHILRHSCLQYLVSHNVSMPIVQKVAGHNSILTTSLYFEINDNQVKEKYDSVF